MKKAMFRYKMALEGYSDTEIQKIEEWIQSRVSKSRVSEFERSNLRDAIFEYSLISTDSSMIPAFVRAVDDLYLEFDGVKLYRETARLVALLVAGWCK